MRLEQKLYEPRVASALAAFGFSSSEAATALQSEDGLVDLLGRVEIHVDNQAVASSNLAYADVEGDRLILSFSEKYLTGDAFANSLPLGKYASNGAKLTVARTVCTLPGHFTGNYSAVTLIDGEVRLQMVAGGPGSGVRVEGELHNLTDEDIANLAEDDTLIGRFLATGEGLESDASFCPSAVQMQMTPRLQKLYEIVGPLRPRKGVVVHSPPGPNVDLVFVHSELGINELYRTDGKSQTMKGLFAHFLGQVRLRDEAINLKSLRFTVNGKTLFPSSAGKQTPDTLGMKDGDKIVVSTIAPSPNEAPPVERRATKKSKKPSRKGSKKGKGKCKSRNRPSHAYSVVGEEKQLWIEHDRLLSRVLEEAEMERFRAIRQELNAMTLERTEPKVKRARQKQAPAINSLPALPLEGHGDKAMKSRFVIHVGEVQNLYKSTKPSKRLKSRLAKANAITVDLHGFTKEDALTKLDNELPQWVDVAMRGDHPWVIRVVIVCGKGSRALSETVEHWIGRNEKVANAPKNLHM